MTLARSRHKRRLQSDGKKKIINNNTIIFTYTDGGRNNIGRTVYAGRFSRQLSVTVSNFSLLSIFVITRTGRTRHCAPPPPTVSNLHGRYRFRTNNKVNFCVSTVYRRDGRISDFPKSRFDVVRLLTRTIVGIIKIIIGWSV